MNIESKNIDNISGQNINSSEDETVILLRRIVKMLESNTVVDANMRQRLNVESGYIFGSYYLNSVNYPTITEPRTSNIPYLATWAGPIDPRWTNIEQARIAYNTRIRKNIINI